MYVGSLVTVINESDEKSKEKEERSMYNKFKAANKEFMDKHPKLAKLGLIDQKGLTGKGGSLSAALAGGTMGALGGLALGGPAGAAAGAIQGGISGALGGGAGTKFGRYLNYKNYGKKYDKKGEVDW